MTNQLAQLTQAERMLAEVATVEEALSLVDFAAAARDLAKRAKLGAASVNHAMLIRLRAERLLAEIVDEGQKAGTIETPGGDGDRPKIKPNVRDSDNGSDHKPETLDDLGIERRRLAEARKLASLTDAQLVAAAEQASEEDRELTRSSLLKEAARQRVPEPAVTPEPASADGGLFRCVVIDPPWPMPKIERDERPTQGQTLDYPTMPVWCERPSYGGDLGPGAVPIFNYDNELRGYETPCWRQVEWWADPDNGVSHDTNERPDACNSIECAVGAQLSEAADNDGCHVYLWTTHRFLPDALDLFERWGVAYQCLMTWRKNVGITPFSWMYDTEHVLFGRLGSLRLERLGLRLSFEAPAQGHSVKPDVFFDRVTQASPEPRLEMFARKPREGFTVWGNEVTDGVL